MIPKERYSYKLEYQRVEEPFLLPSEIRKQRKDEMETRKKNRANRKRLKNSGNGKRRY